MYETLHLEIARQRQADFLRESRNARLAREAERRPSEKLVAFRSMADSLRAALARRPAAVRRTQTASS